MSTLRDYVEAYAAKVGGFTEAAHRLDMTYQGLIRIRKKGGGIEPDKAMMIADELGLDPLKVLAAAAAQRTKSPLMRKRWEDLAKGAATVVLLAVAVSYSDAPRAATAESDSHGTRAVISIMRLFRRWLTRLLTMSATPRFALKTA